jgi:hypothetical protein
MDSRKNKKPKMIITHPSQGIMLGGIPIGCPFASLMTSESTPPKSIISDAVINAYLVMVPPY